jgi:hypothetical protein
VSLPAVQRQLSYYYNVPESAVSLAVIANTNVCVDVNGESSCTDDAYSVQVLVSPTLSAPLETLEERYSLASDTLETPQPLVLELPFQLDNVFYFTETGVDDFYVEMDLVGNSGFPLEDAQVSDASAFLAQHLSAFFAVDASRVNLELIPPRFPMQSNASSVRVTIACDEVQLGPLLDRGGELTSTATVLIPPQGIAGMANAVQTVLDGQMVNGQFVQCITNFGVYEQTCKCKTGYQVSATGSAFRVRRGRTAQHRTAQQSACRAAQARFPRVTSGMHPVPCEFEF